MKDIGGESKNGDNKAPNVEASEVLVMRREAGEAGVLGSEVPLRTRYWCGWQSTLRVQSPEHSALWELKCCFG